jgi:hypothetical protein
VREGDTIVVETGTHGLTLRVKEPEKATTEAG